MAPKKILIVDDEPDIRDVVSIFLSANGFETVEARDGADAVEIVQKEHNFDLLILDVMMPGMSGIETLRTIRTFSNVPALFLTAKTQEADKAEAYANGGDDYLPKPFSQNELLMKVNSLIRRYRVYNAHEGLESSLKHFDVDPRARRVLKDGVDLGLTDTEFDLFSYFASRRGVPSDTKTIYESVWGEKYLPSAANTVMVHILNLRKKIEEDPAQPKILKTVWGKGYQIG